MARAAVLGRLTWRVATVAGAREEGTGARTLELDVPGWPGHEAGQHVDVRLTAPDGYTATRAYSIASAPDGDLVEVTVARVEDGEVSPYLVDVAEKGAQVEIRGPLGGWFVWRPSQPEPVQLLAGGTGLVPLMAMVRARRRAGAQTRMRLLCSVRDPEVLLYRAELDDAAGRGDGLQVSVAYTRRAPHGVAAGRIDADRLREAAFGPDIRPTCYVCGPTGFVESMAGLLLAAGHDSRSVRTERFGPTGGSR
jgi:ferredoxin-NADP reductase